MGETGGSSGEAGGRLGETGGSSREMEGWSKLMGVSARASGKKSLIERAWFGWNF